MMMMWLAVESSTSVWVVGMLLVGLLVVGGAAGWVAGRIAHVAPGRPIVAVLTFWLTAASAGGACVIVAGSVDLARLNADPLEEVLLAWATSLLPWTVLIWCLSLAVTLPSTIAWAGLTPLIARRIPGAHAA